MTKLKSHTDAGCTVGVRVQSLCSRLWTVVLSRRCLRSTQRHLVKNARAI